MDEKAAIETAAQDRDDNEMGMLGPVSTKQSYILKTDLRLIPILGCTYTILFLDRTNSKLERLASDLQADMQQSRMPESKA